MGLPRWLFLTLCACLDAGVLPAKGVPQSDNPAEIFKTPAGSAVPAHDAGTPGLRSAKRRWLQGKATEPVPGQVFACEGELLFFGLFCKRFIRIGKLHPIYEQKYWDCSETLLDAYSWTHGSHGILFFLALGSWNVDKGGWRTRAAAAAAFMIEFAWEAGENTLAVINSFRQYSGPNGVSRYYKGDSVINVIGDLSFCMGYYLMAWSFTKIGLWWIPVVILLFQEIVLTFRIRDNLLFVFIGLFYKIPGLADRQKEAELKKKCREYPEEYKEECKPSDTGAKK